MRVCPRDPGFTQDARLAELSPQPHARTLQPALLILGTTGNQPWTRHSLCCPITRWLHYVLGTLMEAGFWMVLVSVAMSSRLVPFLLLSSGHGRHGLGAVNDTELGVRPLGSCLFVWLWQWLLCLCGKIQGLEDRFVIHLRPHSPKSHQVQNWQRSRG